MVLTPAAVDFQFLTRRWGTICSAGSFSSPTGKVELCLGDVPPCHVSVCASVHAVEAEVSNVAVHRSVRILVRVQWSSLAVSTAFGAARHMHHVEWCLQGDQ